MIISQTLVTNLIKTINMYILIYISIVESINMNYKNNVYNLQRIF
jgi:hypothetical protein